MLLLLELGPYTYALEWLRAWADWIWVREWAFA